MRLHASALRSIRFAAAIFVAGSTAACFQPLYGERSLSGDSAVREALAAVDVAEVKLDVPRGHPMERIPIETRNQLVFELTGGSGNAPITHRLTVRLIPQGSTVVIDPVTQRPEFNSTGFDAHFTLVEVASGKAVTSGIAISRVTYNAPGQEQRFARQRAMRDADSRAAKQIAEQIRSRLASYFVAGT